MKAASTTDKITQGVRAGLSLIFIPPKPKQIELSCFRYKTNPSLKKRLFTSLGILL